MAQLSVKAGLLQSRPQDPDGGGGGGGEGCLQSKSWKQEK